MILRNRSFVRRAPSRDAKVIYIFCEGKKREPQYFKYFEEIDSRIKFEIIAAEENGNNSPIGLFEKASNFFNKDSDNYFPKFELADIDEVWFVIDTDKWGDKIDALRAKCKENTRWFIAQSNPCFEVWLYYHLKDHPPAATENLNESGKWKLYVNSIAKGGFNSRKHPVLIEDAVKNSKANYSETNGIVNFASTELFKLADSFLPLVQEVIRKSKFEMEE